MWVHLKYGMSQKIWELNSTITKTAITLLLPTILHWINKKMNESDEVWRLVHWELGMSQIIRKLHWIKKPNWSYLLSLTIFDWIDGMMNRCDKVRSLVHHKYGMSWILQICEMSMDSLVGFVYWHNYNPCPWWVFDNIVKILKQWANYSI